MSQKPSYVPITISRILYAPVQKIRQNDMLVNSTSENLRKDDSDRTIATNHIALRRKV